MREGGDEGGRGRGREGMRGQWRGQEREGGDEGGNKVTREGGNEGTREEDSCLMVPPNNQLNIGVCSGGGVGEEMLGWTMT